MIGPSGFTSYSRHRSPDPLSPREPGVDDGDYWHLHVTGAPRDDGLPEPPPFPSLALRSGTTRSRRRASIASSRPRAVVRPGLPGNNRALASRRRGLRESRPPRKVEEDDYLLHPAFLDACLHLYPALVRKSGTFDDDGEVEPTSYVPIGLDAFHLYRAGVDGGGSRGCRRPRRTGRDTAEDRRPRVRRERRRGGAVPRRDDPRDLRRSAGASA